MGGPGSGLRRSNRFFVEDCLTLSIADLARAGIFEPDGIRPGVVEWNDAGYDQARSAQIGVGPASSDGLTVELRYCVETGGEGVSRDVVEPVRLTMSKTCYYGWRHWFICPACGRRCGNLHLPPGQEIFACRRCHGLWYRSQLYRSAQTSA